MLFSDSITLIAIVSEKGPNGFPEDEEISRREIFANKKSISRIEYYQASAQNIKLDIVFEVNSFEYDGELSLEYRDYTYNIVRTYEKDHEVIELVCSRLE